MARILSSDLLIADVIVPVDGNPQLAALLEKYNLQPGGKTNINDEQREEFLAAIGDSATTFAPGGSSANLLTTLCKLLGKDIEVRFLGVAGEGQFSNAIRDSLTEAGINLLPGRLPSSQVIPHSAISFVMVFPDGQCTIATHPGNARDILKPAMLAEHLVKNSDILLVQGSLWQKFPSEFVGRMQSLCTKHTRQLWLTLPTQPQLSLKESEHIRHLIPDAMLVLGNENELVRLYGVPIKTALTHLQRALKEKAKTEAGVKSPIGFITMGKKGAAVITTHTIEQFPSEKIEESEIINTIGAGDTAFAGFAAGLIKGLPHALSAQIGMALASEKLRINGPRLADPKTILAQKYPDLARNLK